MLQNNNSLTLMFDRTIEMCSDREKKPVLTFVNKVQCSAYKIYAS